jgi:hypothetical protein
MKKIIGLMLSLVLVVTLSGCADYAVNTGECEPEIIEVEVEVPGACETPEDTHGTETSGEAAEIDGLNVFYVNHISGEGHETPRPVKVLFEFKTLKYTKYQIAFLACT